MIFINDKLIKNPPPKNVTLTQFNFLINKFNITRMKNIYKVKKYLLLITGSMIIKSCSNNIKNLKISLKDGLRKKLGIGIINSLG